MTVRTHTEDAELVGCAVCGHLACVCATKAAHADGCAYRRAVTCPAAIECEHGYDVCPTCDPCTCNDNVRTEAR